MERTEINGNVTLCPKGRCLFRTLIRKLLKYLSEVLLISHLFLQKVDQRKLNKAEAKLKEKKEKRVTTDKKENQSPIILEMATASQVCVHTSVLIFTFYFSIGNMVE